MTTLTLQTLTDTQIKKMVTIGKTLFKMGHTHDFATYWKVIGDNAFYTNGHILFKLKNSLLTQNLDCVNTVFEHGIYPDTVDRLVPRNIEEKAVWNVDEVLNLIKTYKKENAKPKMADFKGMSVPKLKHKNAMQKWCHFSFDNEFNISHGENEERTTFNFIYLENALQLYKSLNVKEVSLQLADNKNYPFLLTSDIMDTLITPIRLS